MHLGCFQLRDQMWSGMPAGFGGGWVPSTGWPLALSVGRTALVDSPLELGGVQHSARGGLSCIAGRVQAR